MRAAQSPRPQQSYWQRFPEESLCATSAGALEYETTDEHRWTLIRASSRSPAGILVGGRGLLIKRTQHYGFSGGFSAMPSSSSWPESTGEGASAMRSTAAVVLGKAMTSRMDFSPASSATTRSSPSAMPPWGGVPYVSASRKKPKRRRNCSSL